MADILAARDHGIAPCERVLVALDRCRLAIECHLADMLALRETLDDLRRQGAELPLDDVEGKKCVCTLIKTHGRTDNVVVGRVNQTNDSKDRP